jgi:hypothetical protein
MPISYAVLNQGQLVVERWQGLITLDEHNANHQRQQADSTIAAQAALLVDAQSAILDALDTNGSWPTPTPPFYQNRFSRCAIIVRTNLYDAAARIAQQLTAQGTSAIVFVNLPIACTWIGLDLGRAMKQLAELAEPPTTSTPHLPPIELGGEALVTHQKAHGRRGATGRRLLGKLLD